MKTIFIIDIKISSISALVCNSSDDIYIIDTIESIDCVKSIIFDLIKNENLNINPCNINYFYSDVDFMYEYALTYAENNEYNLDQFDTMDDVVDWYKNTDDYDKNKNKIVAIIDDNISYIIKDEILEIFPNTTVYHS